MHIKAILVGMAFATSLATAPLAAQGLTGTWELSAEGGRGAQTITLELVESGDALTGTVTMAMGGPRGGRGGRGGGGGAARPGGGGPQTLEISDGTVSGSDFTFAIVLDFGGNSVTMQYSGSVDGDEMEGRIEGGRGGDRPFSGKRGGQLGRR